MGEDAAADAGADYADAGGATADDADDDRGARGDVAAAGGDRDEAGEDAVADGGNLARCVSSFGGGASFSLGGGWRLQMAGAS